LEVIGYNSRVVLVDEESQHEYTMFCGSAEFYAMDRLRDCPHTFENGVALNNVGKRLMRAIIMEQCYVVILPCSIISALKVIGTNNLCLGFHIL
jgi:hypothetical protein